jgi:hypothetical protein
MAKKICCDVDLKATIIGAIAAIIVGAVVAGFLPQMYLLAVAFIVGGAVAAHVAKDKKYEDGAKTGAAAGAVAALLVLLIKMLNFAGTERLQALCTSCMFSGGLMANLIVAVVIGAVLGAIGGAIGSMIKK